MGVTAVTRATLTKGKWAEAGRDNRCYGGNKSKKKSNFTTGEVGRKLGEVISVTAVTRGNSTTGGSG